MSDASREGPATDPRHLNPFVLTGATGGATVGGVTGAEYAAYTSPYTQYSPCCVQCVWIRIQWNHKSFLLLYTKCCSIDDRNELQALRPPHPSAPTTSRPNDASEHLSHGLLFISRCFSYTAPGIRIPPVYLIQDTLQPGESKIYVRSPVNEKATFDARETKICGLYLMPV
ncbi:hypothetical protein CEXT_750431 [Caerostris extrusa]|uniref:Uncharacterized protein n=1 Tax=Caerostris extrusa TaxID=172846 RepID=A0AAV4TSJ5_CAEEX|nr:hypothetical protein CEXT_750431 [Caerostris extrusa]